MSRGEYDVVVIPRLVALLERYGIKGTFFTPGHTIDSTPEAVTRRLATEKETLARLRHDRDDAMRRLSEFDEVIGRPEQ